MAFFFEITQSEQSIEYYSQSNFCGQLSLQSVHARNLATDRETRRVGTTYLEYTIRLETVHSNPQNLTAHNGFSPKSRTKCPRKEGRVSGLNSSQAGRAKPLRAVDLFDQFASHSEVVKEWLLIRYERTYVIAKSLREWGCTYNLGVRRASDQQALEPFLNSPIVDLLVFVHLQERPGPSFPSLRTHFA